MTTVSPRVARTQGGVLRLHQFLPSSRANGPGTRAVIWVQGCTLGCPNCFNPWTHPASGGSELITSDQLFVRIAALGEAIEGITISGGEPLQQAQPLLTLLERVRRETRLSVLLFSGYTWNEIQQMPQAGALLPTVDVLIAGRYVAGRRLAKGLRGSANKTVHLLTGRYCAADLETVPAAEAIITPSGELILSGIDPLKW